MAQTHLDPEALRSFARFLQEHCSHIRDRTGSLRTNKNEAGMLWKDQRFREFEEHYDAAMTDIDQFLSTAEGICERLMKKAMLADQYLRRG